MTISRFTRRVASSFTRLPVQAPKPRPLTVKTATAATNTHHISSLLQGSPAGLAGALVNSQQDALPRSHLPFAQTWTERAIQEILKEKQACSQTPITLLCELDGVPIYVKDERRQPTGSHKHRLARSLFLHGLKNGHIKYNTHLIEASSGGTACSEAYFARLLSLPYTAVVSKTTPQNKIDAIKKFGGNIVTCEPNQDKAVAVRLAAQQPEGYFIDQFANAGLATDPHDNIASEIFTQLGKLGLTVPTYFLCGAGTGQTSTTFGAYAEQYGFATKVIVPDPENSAFHRGFLSGNREVTTQCCSLISGIGRPRVEPAFDFTKISAVMPVPDAASIAACHFLHNEFGLYTGGSSGVHFYACVQLIESMRKKNETGSILMLVCDDGGLYPGYFNAAWLKEKNIDIGPYMEKLQSAFNRQALLEERSSLRLAP